LASKDNPTDATWPPVRGRRGLRPDWILGVTVLYIGGTGMISVSRVKEGRDFHEALAPC
jgi:hypothetical protein